MLSTLIKTINYIKYFVLMIGFSFVYDINAGSLKDWFLFKKLKNETIKNKDKKINIPWENDNNCLADFQCIFHGKIVDENNKLITIESMKDNVVILVFSTTWCPNCPEVIRQMDSLNNKLKELGIDNVKIIHLNIGDESLSGVKKHLKKINVKLDPYWSVAGADVGVSVIPTVMIFDKNGKAICGYIGSSLNYLSDEFVKFIIVVARK